LVHPSHYYYYYFFTFKFFNHFHDKCAGCVFCCNLVFFFWLLNEMNWKWSNLLLRLNGDSFFFNFNKICIFCTVNNRFDKITLKLNFGYGLCGVIFKKKKVWNMWYLWIWMSLVMQKIEFMVSWFWESACYNKQFTSRYLELIWVVKIIFHKN
jgi:hypothetical protein